MSNATGARTRVVGITQAQFRQVPASPEAELLYITSLDLTDSTPLEQDPTLAGGYRGEQKGLRGRLDVPGTANVVVGSSIGFWLKHLIGQPATTGTGPYVHTFQVGDGPQALPAALGIERDYGEGITGEGRRIRNLDMRVASGSFAFSASTTTQTASFTLVGASPREFPAAPIDADPMDFGHAGFELAGINIVLDGGDTEFCIETLNLNWDNDLDTDQYCISGGGLRHGLDEGLAIITGDGVGMFDSAVLLRKQRDDEPLAVAITLQRGTGDGTAGNEKLVITVPVSVLEATSPAINGPRGLRQNFTFRAYREAGSEVAVTAVLHTPRATI